MKPFNLRISRELLFYYHGIGDSLLLNAVLYGLGQQTQQRYVVGSPYPEIYGGNPFVIHLPFPQIVNYKAAQILEFLGIVKKITHIDYYHEGHPPKKHILRLLSERLGLKKTPSRPLVILSEEEKASQLLPPSEKPWVAIQSTGIKKWTDNKNWGASNFNEVVRLLSDKYSFVQLGMKGDPVLDGVIDRTGELSLRQVFCVLNRCSSFIGQVGFLMHAASAMRLPSVIVYGGFEAPWQSGYEENINLFTKLHCSPCWLEEKCPWDKKCMAAITPAMVSEEFRIMMGKPQLLDSIKITS